MEIAVVGLNHKTAPVQVRERLDFSKLDPQIYLSRLTAHSCVRSAVILSTCNRVEVYSCGEKLDEILGATRTFLRDYHGLKEEDVQPYLFEKSNRDAVRHLFRVASSLDSMVVGEPQILGQVKDAYLASSTSSFTNPILERLFHRSFSVAKRVRTETQVGRAAISISFAAVELARKIFGNLSGHRAMILGAGEMAELVAKHLQKQNLAELMFSNRTYDHSVDLAREYGAIPILFEQRDSYMIESDIVIVSTGAPHYIVQSKDVLRWMAARTQRPMFFIDISVPRNVDPLLNEIENVYIYNIDDLQSVVETNRNLRSEEAARAEMLIDEEVTKFFRNVETMRLSPVIQELQAKYDLVLHEELRRLDQELEAASAADKEAIERSAHHIVRKIINDPILFLKSGDASDAGERSEVLRKVFALGKGKPGENSS